MVNRWNFLKKLPVKAHIYENAPLTHFFQQGLTNVIIHKSRG